MTSNARFIVIAALIVLGCVFVILSYARLILCAWCRSPWAVYQRPIGDLCRSCAQTFDRQRSRAVGRRRPRSLLQRIMGRAA